MASPCAIPLPDWLAALFEGLDRDPVTRQLIASAVAAEMCSRLTEEGFGDFHFYTLNRAELVYAICRVLGSKGAVQ
jgi:methylenetetrahydrofolate reductase (NADPH)